MSVKFEDLKLTVKEMAALIEGARRFVPLPPDDEVAAEGEEPLVTKRDTKETVDYG